MKTCNHCLTVKPLDKFSNNPKNKKDGKAAKCKKCHDLVYNKKVGNNIDHVIKNAYVWP